MMRKTTLWLTCVVFLFLSACQEKTPPSVILLSMDTLRADRLGCYGYGRDTSPNMDLFSKDAVVFENCFAQSSWTLPSHATLFTSLHPSFHKTIRHYDTLDPSLVLLPEILKEKGFSTAAFVNGGYMEARFGFNQGFSQYYSTDPKEGNLEVMLPRIEAWLEKAPAQPLFLFVHCYDVHDPYDPSPEFKFKYAKHQPDIDSFIKSKAKLLMNGTMLSCEEIRKLAVLRRSRPVSIAAVLHLNEEGNGSEIAEKIFDCFPPLFEFEDSAGAVRYLSDCYDGGVNALDHHFKRLEGLLRKNHLWENSLIILTSDHGEEFNEHGGLGHGRTVHREMTHVPLMIKFPGDEKRGARLKGSVGLIDIMPTVLDFLGIQPPEAAQGKSFLPLLEGENPGEDLYAETGSREQRHAFSVRTEKWLYIWTAAAEEERLYDLEHDPGEKRNVAGEHPDIAAGFKQAIDEYVQSSEASVYRPGELKADKALQDQLQALGYVH